MPILSVLQHASRLARWPGWSILTATSTARWPDRGSPDEPHPLPRWPPPGRGGSGPARCEGRSRNSVLMTVNSTRGPSDGRLRSTREVPAISGYLPSTPTHLPSFCTLTPEDRSAPLADALETEVRHDHSTPVNGRGPKNGRVPETKTSHPSSMLGEPL